MDLDFEDLITRSIICNRKNTKEVLVKTTKTKDYDLIVNKKDSSFWIKVKKDGCICDACGEIYEEERDLNRHKRLKKCRKMSVIETEIKEALPLAYNLAQFLEMDLSPYDEQYDNSNWDDFEEDVDEDDLKYDTEDLSVLQKGQVACEECGKVCATKGGLRMHMKSHQPKVTRPVKRGRRT